MLDINKRQIRKEQIYSKFIPWSNRKAMKISNKMPWKTKYWKRQPCHYVQSLGLKKTPSYMLQIKKNFNSYPTLLVISKLVSSSSSLHNLQYLETKPLTLQNPHYSKTTSKFLSAVIKLIMWTPIYLQQAYFPQLTLFL